MKLLTNPIVVLLLGLILGVGTGLATFWKAAAPLVAQARSAKAKAGQVGKPDAPWDFWTIEIENLSNELKDSKAALKKKEEELAAREARLLAERQELVKQRAELEALRNEIGSRMTEIQADELKNLKNLVNLYSSLTPKATLTIFKQLDDATVVKLLALMKADVVTPLFEEMTKQGATDPEMARRAAQLTERLRLIKSTKTAAN
jgi:flagellar motility protein MotE (MotC chaperone)